MSVYQMSISATLLIIAVVIVRALALYKLPKKTFLILWSIVMCRLLIPFSIPSRFSIYTSVDMLKRTFMQTTDYNGYVSTEIRPHVEPVLPNIWHSVELDPSTVSISPFTVIWLIGMCACALFFMVTYIKCRNEFKTSLPIENDFIDLWLQKHLMYRKVQIRQSDRIKAPLTYGIIRPIVLLPKTTDWTDKTRLQYILTHEFVHIRRFDLLYKLLLTAALCVHWFNPLVWVMYVLANRDIEVSCDETLVRTFGETMKSAYATMLIGMEEKKSRLTPLMGGFSKNSIEERIVSIMKMKRISLTGMILAVALVISLSAIFATSVKSLDKDDESAMSVKSKIEKTTGENMISDDNGKTWMNETDYQKKYPGVDVDWWTYEEYKEWFEQEKTALQKLVNAPGWSKERVDSAIKNYEQTLEDIKNGAKVSKSVDGDNSLGMATGKNFSNSDFTEQVSENADVKLIPNSSNPPAVIYSANFQLDNGDVVDLGSYSTEEERFSVIKAYCDEQVELGNMTEEEADKIINNCQ
jgi:beta-lactamase regulating signal transducer with metallopeptidase domain